MEWGRIRSYVEKEPFEHVEAVLTSDAIATHLYGIAKGNGRTSGYCGKNVVEQFRRWCKALGKTAGE
jgi:hypothetical protein